MHGDSGALGPGYPKALVSFHPLGFLSISWKTPALK